MATTDGFAITAATRVVGIIGSPVRHSLSPVIHNAAFRSLGLDYRSVAFEVHEGYAKEAVDGIRALGIHGVSVTMPHKATVVPALDELAPSAERLGVVNCIARDGERLIGHSTDGAGFVTSVRAEYDFDVSGSACVVVGAGGAARSIALALNVAGADSVVVVNRSIERAQELVQLVGSTATVGSGEDIPAADLVVNTTSVGMAGTAMSEGLPFDPDLLDTNQLLVDIIYSPLETPLMMAARARGVRVGNGVAMLVHQAAEQIEIWTRQRPNVSVMMDAALGALAPLPS